MVRATPTTPLATALHAIKKLLAVYMVKHSLIFVCKLLYQNPYDFDKRYLFLLLFLAKCADVSTLDTPLPLMSATVSIFPPPPLKNADILYGRPLSVRNHGVLGRDGDENWEVFF